MSTSWEQHGPNGDNLSAHAPSAVEESSPAFAEVAPGSPSTVTPFGQTAPPPTAAEDTGANHIDRIRDILFGPHMRDYQSRFTRLEQTFQMESAEVRDNTRRTIERLETFVRLELDALNSRFRSERDERGATVGQISRDMKELGESISRRLAEVDDHAAGSHHELRDQLLRHGREVTELIQVKQQEAAALLEQRFNELRRDKTDRAALASLFSEVSLRLNNEFHIPGVEH